jgi:hypothetical protein
MGINPRVTFEQMFGEVGSADRRLRRLRQKQSMLDSIAEEASRMRRRLGPADTAILDEYLTNVREVEQQLDRMDARAGAEPEGAVAPLGIPDSFDDHMTVTYDLVRLAFQGRSYAHIGIPEPHHPVSHHADSPEGIAKYAKITTYHTTKLAEFVGKLQATADGDGTLLDRSLVYFGSGMSNGNAHDRNNAPALVLGGANGKLKGNRHIAVENKEPTSNLLLGFADLAGAEVETIGVSTGRLTL